MSEQDKNNRMNCQRANELDLVAYLQELGFPPARVRGNDHWYCSPLRDEKTPSFKVNARLNAWYDHGLAEGGTLVDFVIKYFCCSVADFLGRLEGGHLFFSRPDHVQGNALEVPKKERIIVTDVAPLSSPALTSYLEARRINAELAKRNCKQVNVKLYDRAYFGIGFSNQSGGWELRNAFQKYAVSPKDFSLIKNGSDRILVFEGFMDFLSFLSAAEPACRDSLDYLVLNGVGMFERSREVLENYRFRGLCFDQDVAGRKMTAYAMGIDAGYTDESDFYKGFKDVNDWLMQTAAKQVICMTLVGGLPPLL